MRRLFPILCFLLSVITLSAQNLTVSGVVMAADEPDPVIGANVSVKGTTTGTITDFDGNFSLSAKQGDVLVVSFMGYKTQELKITSSAPVRITLQPDNVMLQEVVAIGYGTMKKSDLTGAITSVSAEQLTKAPVAGLDQALQGRAAGVTVTTNSGQPGEAATIRIRGIGSALGGNDPLYVVDGVITNDIAFLSPNDIQSMEILKDASATAIYGSRGANGVILITTKTGGEGKVNISFDAYWGIQNRWKKLDLMDTDDMVRTKLALSVISEGKPGRDNLYKYVNEGLGAFIAGNTNDSYYPVNFDYANQHTDWQDEVFNPNAFMQNYNLSVDGGSEKAHYAFSANYFSQEGTIIGSNYQRFTLRLNSDFKIRSWLTFGEHLSFAYSDGRNAMNNNSSPGASVISAALAMAPWDPTHYPEGSVNSAGEDLSGKVAASSNFKNVTNPFSMVYESFPLDKKERLVGDIYLNIEPVKGLVIKPSVSMDLSILNNRLFKNSYDYSTYDNASKNFLSRSLARSSSILEETTITYSKTIDKHSFSVMAGQTWQEDNYYSIGNSGAAILNGNIGASAVVDNPEAYWYLSNTTDDNKNSASDEVSRLRRLSFLGRAFYSYDSRYMITINFRADASSKFTKNPWGFFPSAALSWRISQEPWMENSREWLDNLKIRAGWGQVGNDGVPSAAFQQTIGAGDKVFYGYPLGIGNNAYSHYGAAVLTQPDLNGKWETNEQWDAGVDFSFWNGKLAGSVDYFMRNTLDALMYVNAPAQVGNRYPMIRNVGNIRNQGIELTLNHDNTVGKVTYHIGGNLSWIKNELTALNGGSRLADTYTMTDVNIPLNSFWGYDYLGVYKTDADAAYFTNVNLHAGDSHYRDVVKDGLLNNDDQIFIGNPFPKLTYGLNLGVEFYGVDIQLFFQGVYGNKIYNALRMRTEGAGDQCAMGAQMKDVWIDYDAREMQYLAEGGLDYMDYINPDGTIPNPVGALTNNAASSRFIEDGSYLRLKNMQIGYTLPKKITEKFGCSRLRFYITGSNVFTLTKYTGYDPEVGNGVDYGNYPQSRTFTFGLNANF